MTDKLLLGPGGAGRGLFRLRHHRDRQILRPLRPGGLDRAARHRLHRFRAPSLQQQYFTQIASVVTNGVPVLTGTFPSTSTVGTALGGLALEPEKSTNLSAGTVIRFGGFDLTVDAYRIHIRNQIGLSENISATGSTAAVNRRSRSCSPPPIRGRAPRASSSTGWRRRPRASTWSRIIAGGPRKRARSTSRWRAISTT